MKPSWVISLLFVVSLKPSFSALELTQTPRMRQISTAYQAMQAMNDTARNELADSTGEPLRLKVVTINLGLLRLVPDYALRSQNLRTTLSRSLQNAQSAPDIVFIQELWYQTDFNTVTQLAANLGYEIAARNFRTDRVNSRGLQILIKANKFHAQNGRVFNVQYLHYVDDRQRALVGNFEFGVERGALYGTLTTHSGHQILIANTHLTAGIGETNTRMQQNQRFAQLIQTQRRNKHYVIVGGDFNYSPELELIPRNQNNAWDANRQPYLNFYRRTGLRDVVPSYGQQDGRLFTGDRLFNPTNLYSFAWRSEPNQRVDFIWVAANHRDRQLAVQDTRLVFNEPLIDDRGMLVRSTNRNQTEPPQQNGLYVLGQRTNQPSRVFLSDHVGVYAALALF